MVVASLIDRFPAEWRSATQHPFLAAVGTGSEEGRAAFACWMAQDVVFVADLVAFQARLVARAPRPAQQVLAEGVVGLLAELDWFDQQATALGIELNAEALPATLQYRLLLDRLDAQTYPLAIVGLWTLERVYLDAWRYAGDAGDGGRFGVAIEHWTEPGFADYVSRLEQVADAAMGEASPADVLETVRDVLVLEQEFWDMAWPADSAAGRAKR